ncbi:chemotaxis protein CheW [Oceanospirillum maris]|jgi:purine-binding chemotaxis protein CheW|uniref:chemotaxis protein CheW n=1 Tax=Oceanospirillum maris TaxID=64977 RepID=UPI0004239998|nr:chemotaxis protein CheW [Oceanospirillum maris]
MNNQWISFCLAGEKYAHPVESIKEVLNFQEPSPVPGAPYDVEGILNIRGEVLTVISARKLMNLPQAPSAEDAKIISIETDDGLCGIVVDNVEAIVGFDQDTIESPPNYESTQIIMGTVHREGQLFIVADFQPHCEHVARQM